MSTLDELSARVRAFVTERDWERYHSPRNLAMALSVEAGELLELFLWTADDGAQPASPERAARVADEAADVLMCLLNFCDRAGVDLEQALIAKLAKAAAKYPADQVRGRALKYDEYPTWSGDRHVDRHFLTEVPPGLDPEAARFLRDRGVPVELRLPGWVGPTLFTSALGTGRLGPSAAGDLVLGTIRQDDGAAAAEFVIHGAEVVLVDLPEPPIGSGAAGSAVSAGGAARARTVNRSVPQFVEAIEAFHGAFSAAAERGAALLDRPRQIDPQAFQDPDGYWALWLEQLDGT